MKTLTSFLILLTLSCQLLASDQKGDGGDLLYQRIHAAKKELIASFKEISPVQLDELDQFSKKWWTTDVVMFNQELPRYQWFPTLLRKSKIISTEEPCQTHDGPKPACLLSLENQELTIHLQTSVWQNESLDNLKIILIHEIGHALNEKDHDLLTVVAIDFLESEKKRKAEKALLIIKKKKILPPQAIIQAGLGFPLADDSLSFSLGATISPFVVSASKDSAPLYGIASSKLEITQSTNTLTPQTQINLRLIGLLTAVNKKTIFDEESNDFFAFIPAITPAAALSIGYNGVIDDQMSLHQIILGNLGLYTKFSPGEGDQILLDAFLNMGIGITGMKTLTLYDAPGYAPKIGSWESTFALNTGINATYIHSFADHFSLGFQYANDLSLNALDAFNFEQKAYFLLDFSSDHSFLIFVGPEQKISRRITERTYTSYYEQIGEKSSATNSKSSIAIGLQLRF